MTPLPLTSLPLHDGALLIDNSFIEALTACPRKLEYSYLRKRVQATENAALNFGTAIHKALEFRYTRCQNQQMTSELEQECHDKILQPFFESSPTPEGDHRTLDFAMEILREYNLRRVVEPFNLLTDQAGKTMCELSFALPLMEVTYLGQPIKVIYIGRVDLPTMREKQIVVMDHKTASMLGDRYFDGQKVAAQFEGYCWAFTKLSGLPVAGFEINGIRTKEKPGRPMKGWSTWWDECFDRHLEYLRPGQLEEWEENTKAHIREFLYHCEQGYLPMRKKACTMYGKCPYYDVCYLPAHQRDQELRSTHFQDNTWSPLKQSNE